MKKFLWTMYKLNKFKKYHQYELNRHRIEMEKKKKEQEKIKKQKEELNRKQLENKKFQEITKPKLDEQERIKHEVWSLSRTVDEIRFPRLYENNAINIKEYIDNNGQYNVDKLYTLRSKVKSLKNRSEKCNFEKECIVENLKLNSLYQNINELINDHKNDVFTEIKAKKEQQIDDEVIVEITPLYRKFINEIVGKTFTKKEKMKMIKRIGVSGLNVEQRKKLISLIKTK